VQVSVYNLVSYLCCFVLYDDYFEGSIKHRVKIGKVKAVSRQSDTQKTVKIHLGDVEMKIEPDSGADVNLMDEFHFTNLRKLSGNKLCCFTQQWR
jgi:hypothetical protein